MNKYLEILGHKSRSVSDNNIPIIKVDSFTNKVSLEWESLSGNNFYQKVMNGTINMASTFPNINRLFLTVNHLEGKDYLILRHPKKDFMLEIGDEFYILFENNDFLEFKIVKKSFHFYNSNNDTFKQVYENRILLYEDDLNKLSINLIKDWRILISKNRKIEGMKPFGSPYHNYKDKKSLQKALKNLFTDYNDTVKNIENYKPIKRGDIIDVKELNETCSLYLMKDITNGFYKIGISNNPKYRERTLQSEKPTINLINSKEFPNRKIAAAFESSLHKTYGDKRLRGEWFELSSDDVNEIKEILK